MLTASVRCGASRRKRREKTRTKAGTVPFSIVYMLTERRSSAAPDVATSTAVRKEIGTIPP